MVQSVRSCGSQGSRRRPSAPGSVALPIVTAAEANGLVVPTPADEHQGHAKVDVRFSNKNSLGVRYNMVRWNKDNEGGGLSLPGTGFIWDNNVDTVHGTFTSIFSDKLLNEVRAQYSTYTDRASDGFCACGVLALASSVVASIVISLS